MSRIVIAALVLIAASTAQPLSAGAQETAEVEARAAFKTAKVHYEQGRYAKALAELERASSIKKLSIFLRYMGDCQMKLARYEEALSIYTRYLRKVPDAPGRAGIEANMKLAREKLRVRRAAEYKGKKLPKNLVPTGKDREDPVNNPRKPLKPPEPIKPPPPEPPTRPMAVAKWALGGLGVVSAVLGVTFNRMAAARSDELLQMVREACIPDSKGTCKGNPDLNWPRAPYSKDHLQAELEIDQFNELAVSSFVIGGAALAASVTFFILDGPRDDEPEPAEEEGLDVTVAPLLGEGATGVQAEVRF